MDEANGLLFNPHSLQTLMYPPQRHTRLPAPTNSHVSRHKNTNFDERCPSVSARDLQSAERSGPVTAVLLRKYNLFQVTSMSFSLRDRILIQRQEPETVDHEERR